MKTIDFERDTIIFNVPDGATPTFSIPNSASAVAAFELPEKGASALIDVALCPLLGPIPPYSKRAILLVFVA